MLSQFLKTPRMTHLKVVKHVFCYLLDTKHLKLVLGGNTSIAGFSDSDWGSHLHCHSISGTVSWSAKKQSIITLSSTEAEYVALTHTAKNIMYLDSSTFD